MLDDKRAVIAERLRLDIVLHEFPEARAAVDVGPSPPGLGATEQSEAHGDVGIIVGATRQFKRTTAASRRGRRPDRSRSPRARTRRRFARPAMDARPGPRP